VVRVTRLVPRAGLLLLALVLLPTAVPQATSGPVAFFTVSASVVGTGRDVTVDASASLPGTGATNVTEFAWRWDEGQPYAAGNATETHRYNRSGVHVVGLRVMDDKGAVAFANQTVLVRGAAPSAYFLPPVVEERDGGLLVSVDAGFSEPSRGATRIVLFEWDWGEGGGFVPGNATERHFYDRPGAYVITLRVTDDEDRSAESTNRVSLASTFWSRMGEVWKDREAFLRGAWLTLQLAVVTTVLGFFLAVVLALLRVSHLKVLRWPAAWYVELIRGTPLLVQILIAWLVLPFVGLKLPILWAGGLALVVNTSAYQAEAIRAGIQGIPTGQMEAATSLGMTYLQAMRHVVFPQAFRLTLPALGNEFIILLKDTSLVSVIGVVELTQVGRIFSARTFLVLETFLAVALVYFVMTYTLSLGLRHLERRLAIPGLGLGGPHP
jgi:His/Glu/Gln/Arg/opine family amino acid ABC transporter permease subunit